MDAVEERFAGLLAEHDVDLTANQREQFASYYEQLVIWNEKFNLTTITEKEQVYIKHFYDSVSLSFYLPLTGITTVADIGSGAGFPSIPLKIMFPHLKVSIFDSLNKRIRFLQYISSELKLDQVICIHARAEDVARESSHRDHYDLVAARAVAKLNVLNELCLPFVNKGGMFIALKGSDPTDEVGGASRSLSELNSFIEHVYSFKLPFENSDRHLILIRKLANTPYKYPRKPKDILNNPL